jgi:hypothetical protein
MMMTDRIKSDYDRMALPCGGIAYFDEGAGYGYRCELCNAVVGSIGQPKRCKDEAQKYENWAKLGGEGWDYFREPEEYEHENE